MNRYDLAQIAEGMKASFEVQLTQEMMAAFRSITGDENPLHCDKEYAKAAGYPNTVAYGMLTASFFSTLVGMYLPGEKALFQSADVSFLAPVFPGQILRVLGEVSYINQAYGQIEIKAQVLNEADEKVAKAKLKVGVRSETGTRA